MVGALAQPRPTALGSMPMGPWPGVLPGANPFPKPQAASWTRYPLPYPSLNPTPPSVITFLSIRQVQLSEQPSSQPWHSSAPPPWSTQALAAWGLQGCFGLASDQPWPSLPHFVARITGRESLTFHSTPDSLLSYGFPQELLSNK